MSAEAVVLAEYRKLRAGGRRPWMAMDDLMAHAASGYMAGVAAGAEPSRPWQLESLAEWEAARAYRTEIITRREAQAARRGIKVHDSFWAHGLIGLMPRAVSVNLDAEFIASSACSDVVAAHVADEAGL